MKKLLSLLIAVTLGFAFVQPVVAEGLSARSIRKLERAQKKQSNKKKENNKKKPDNKVAFDSVCKTISPIRALIKNAYPGHINRNDPRAKGFALVCSASDCPRKFPVTGYYSDGTQAVRLGYYGTWSGNGKPRAYCSAGGAGSCSASQITQDSKKSGRDGKVYLAFDTAKKSCRSFIPGKRNGSPF